MRTLVKFGLADHGRRVNDKVAESAEYETGYKYEIIEGRLYVSPQANAPENWLETWLFRKLWNYADRHLDIVNYVSCKARVFVPRRKLSTVPEPDVAAFHDYPVDRPPELLDWRETSPILVAEVLYDADPHKDLIRNVDLYLRVPSIREYWILDARLSASKPILIVRRRRSARWVMREYYYREKYTTKLLPGFSLLIDPRR
jgi:Uma2 family endonuclease